MNDRRQYEGEVCPSARQGAQRGIERAKGPEYRRKMAGKGRFFAIKRPARGILCFPTGVPSTKNTALPENLI